MAEISKITLPNGDEYDLKDSNAIPSSEKGSANGVAELDSNGIVISSQLPSFVDDVAEYASQSEFPTIGESGKIYVDTATNKTYRWSGSTYVEISPSLALGETSSTAYRGDRGKIAYDYAVSEHSYNDLTDRPVYEDINLTMHTSGSVTIQSSQSPVTLSNYCPLFKKKSIYLVKWDGVEYPNLTVTYNYYSSSDYDYVITGPNNIFTFKTWHYTTNNDLVIYSSSTGSHTFEIYEQQTTLVRLDKKFLPNFGTSASDNVVKIDSSGDITTADKISQTNLPSFGASNADKFLMVGSDGNVTVKATSINGQSLSNDITLSASDVGAVSDTTSINGKNLSGEVVLSASDVEAIPASEKGVASGVATLDENGLIPQSQMPGMVILSYGHNTWDDFLEAYQKNNIIYCRASSNSNPASGSQTRLAFMAYVNNATSPTEVEFQYYRSISSHNATQQGDQVYVYKLNKNNGWSVTVREAYTRVATNNGLTSTWSGGVLTASADIVSTTKLSSAATAATETDGRVYPVALDANGKLAVHVDDESVRISQAEYDALTETEKNSDTVYYIYDAPYDMPDVVTLSLAEYNALSEEEKNNGLFYYVYDEQTAASTLVVQNVENNADSVPSSAVLYGVKSEANTAIANRIQYDDALTLEEIAASTDLTNKVPQASAVKTLGESLSTLNETGNFTPTIASGGSGLTYTDAQGYYYKMGNMVIVSILFWAMKITSPTSDVFAIKLPYINMVTRAMSPVGYHNFGASGVPLMFAANSGTQDRAYLQKQTGTGDLVYKGTDLTGSYTWQANLVYFTDGTKLI